MDPVKTSKYSVVMRMFVNVNCFTTSNLTSAFIGVDMICLTCKVWIFIQKQPHCLTPKSGTFKYGKILSSICSDVESLSVTLAFLVARVHYTGAVSTVPAVFVSAHVGEGVCVGLS